MDDLRRKVFLITGAASGLGRGTAEFLAPLGARLVLVDQNEKALEECTNMIQSLGAETATMRVDVRRPEECAAAAQLAVDRFGTLNGAVCSAGIDHRVPALEMSLDEWQSVLDVNLTGSFLTVQATARAMVASHSTGALVTFASGIAVRGRADGPHYAATKAGVVAMSKSMALELAQYGIRVNIVAPGMTDTPMARSVISEAEMSARAQQVPLGRIGEPADIARVVGFLLSYSSGWLTGQTLHANGGMLMP